MVLLHWPLEQPASGFWTLQTLQNLALARLWALGLCETVGGVAQTVGSGLWRAKSFFSSGPKLPFKRLKPLEPCQWFCYTGRWSSQLLESGRFRRSKASHLLDCGLWALCETVGGVAQIVGSGLWRAKSFFSSGPKLPFKRLKLLKPSNLANGSATLAVGAASFWILDASDAPKPRRLWALGSVRDCGRSCADCGLGALARQVLFSGGPKLPFKRLKPLKPLEPCQWFCHTGRWSSQLLDSGRFRRSKTSHLLDYGLWALCETVGGVAQTVGSGLWRAKSFFSSGPKLPFKRLKPLKPLEPCQWFCHTGRWSSQLLDSGRC